MGEKTIRSYLEKELLNLDTSVQWLEEEKKVFESAKEVLLIFCNYLERRKMIEGCKFTYKAGKPRDLKEAVAFTLFSDAVSCNISALHIGWNGHITAATMLVRRIYELLVDLSFMLQSSTQRRLNRFVAMDYVSRYMRLVNLYPNLSQRQLIKECRNNIGGSFDELRKSYLKHHRKFELRKNKAGKVEYIYSGDWSFGLIEKNNRSSLAKKAEKVELGNFHYKLSYSTFASKSHPDSWHIGSKATITDDALSKITFPILPDKEKHFEPVIKCGMQYITVLFTILAKVFNFYALPNNDKDILDIVKKMKIHEDYKDFFKKVKIPSQSNF